MISNSRDILQYKNFSIGPIAFKSKYNCYKINHNIKEFCEKMLALNMYFQFKQRITQCIKILLTKSPNLSIKKLINKVYNEIGILENISREEIEDLVKTLIKQQDLFLYPKLTQDHILNSIDKKAILVHIDKNPGISFDDLLKAFAFNRSQLIWHLQILEKFQLVSKARVKSKTRLYSNVNKVMSEV